MTDPHGVYVANADPAPASSPVRRASSEGQRVTMSNIDSFRRILSVVIVKCKKQVTWSASD